MDFEIHGLSILNGLFVFVATKYRKNWLPKDTLTACQFVLLGRRPILAAGSTTCSTLCTTRRRWWWRFERVAGNRGANTPGVDGLTVADVEEFLGVPGFLDDLRASVKAGAFRPLPVRERKIPKPGGSGKVRKLGIPVIADRVV